MCCKLVFFQCLYFRNAPFPVDLRITQTARKELVLIGSPSSRITFSNLHVLQHLSWNASKTAGLPQFKYTELLLSTCDHSACEYAALKSIQLNAVLIHLSLFISSLLADILTLHITISLISLFLSCKVNMQ